MTLKSYSLFVLAAFSLASHAEEIVWKEVSVENEILRVLESERTAGWVIVGDIDIDSDGDLDRLVAHEYLAAKDHGEDSYLRWLLYLNNNGKYFSSKDTGFFTLSQRNIEYRRIKESDGNRALIKYEASGGREQAFAVWYKDLEDGGVSRNMRIIPPRSILETSSGDIVSPLIPDSWSDRGMHISDVLKGYRKMEREEAKKFFGSPGGSVDSALNPEEQQTHALKGDVGGAKEEKGGIENRWFYFAVALLVFLGFAMVAILYRRRKAG